MSDRCLPPIRCDVLWSPYASGNEQGQDLKAAPCAPIPSKVKGFRALGLSGQAGPEAVSSTGCSGRLAAVTAGQHQAGAVGAMPPVGSMPLKIRPTPLAEGTSAVRKICTGLAGELAFAQALLLGIAATLPANRLGDPREFGAACAFLCAAQLGFMTGQNRQLDGGSCTALI